MDDAQKFPHHTVGANMPRWQQGDTKMYADRIHEVYNGLIYLESGTKVPATDELLATGPARTGDFYTFSDGVAKLVAGADFQTTAVPVPHALDAAVVSADEQPGARPGEPTSGSPSDPLTKESGE